MTNGRIQSTGVMPGQMDRIVAIMERTVTTDASGGPVESFAVIDAEEWAFVEYPLTGNEESMVGTLEVNTQAIDITVRYRGDITPKHAVYMDGSVLDVITVAPIGRQMFEKIRCIDRGKTVDTLTNGDGETIFNGDNDYIITG